MLTKTRRTRTRTRTWLTRTRTSLTTASKDLQLNIQLQSSKDKNHAQNTHVFYTGTVNMSVFNVNHIKYTSFPHLISHAGSVRIYDQGLFKDWTSKDKDRVQGPGQGLDLQGQGLKLVLKESLWTRINTTGRECQKVHKMFLNYSLTWLPECQKDKFSCENLLQSI